VKDGIPMALRNCVRCGNLMDGRLGSVCPDCRKQEAEAFDRVRAYLREHPQANLREVSEGAGVDPDQIRRFLREGRLELVGDPDALHCERCGASISTGRLCSDCLRELEAAAGTAPPPPTEKARLHLGRSWIEERRERFRR